MATNTIVTESVQPTGGSKAHLDDLATASNSSSHHDEDAQPWAKDGIWRVPLSPLLTASDCHYWAQEFSRVTPMIMAGEGDNEYPLYRNLINEYSNDDNDNENDDNNNHANDDDIQQFPLNDIIRLVAPTLRQHFGVGEVQQTATTNRHHASSSSSSENNNHRDELPLVRLDDAFGLHYNMQQSDTTGALHTDPSDITINICLHASEDIQGSHVVFHHHDHGLTTPGLLSLSSSAGANATNDDDRDAGGTTSTTPSAADERNPSSPRDTVDSSSLHPRPASSSRRQKRNQILYLRLHLYVA